MDLVLSTPKWMLSLLKRNHSHKLLKSLFKCFSISVTCLCWKIRQESSAYSNRSEDTACFISLTYIRKSKGPRIDPWGTPHKIFEMLECLFSMLTKNARSVKYEWNQFTVSLQKPIALNFSISILWSIASNPIWRSISIIPVKRPLSKPFKILSFKYERHKSVDYFVLKPDWYLYKMLYWAK